jgi:hypothetical protein
MKLKSVQPLIHWSYGHKNDNFNYIKSSYIVTFIDKKKIFTFLN